MSDLQDRLIARLQDGPVTFRDWMDACLYGEGGYYMRPGRKTGVGQSHDDHAGGDFATSPTLHPFLAQAVAKEVLATYAALGEPDGFMVVEYGGGEGDLARDASAAIEAALGRSLPWHHVEISPAHREAQAGDGFTHGPAPDAFTGVVVAHEFLDALPVHLMERRMGHWAEMYVTLAKGRPTLTTGFPTQRGTDATPQVDVEDGHRVVANADAKAWFQAIGERLQAGGIIVVDYGAEGRALWERDPEWGTLRTFRDQQHGTDPLDDPGEQDITASIDFAQCRRWAADAGLTEASSESQEAFLLRHGALEALNAIDRDSVEGASQYLRMRQMLLPTAMGTAFRVATYAKGMD